jgi:hypothetical protein
MHKKLVYFTITTRSPSHRCNRDEVNDKDYVNRSVSSTPSSDQHRLSNLQIFTLAKIPLFLFVEGGASILFHLVWNGDGTANSKCNPALCSLGLPRVLANN